MNKPTLNRFLNRFFFFDNGLDCLLNPLIWYCPFIEVLYFEIYVAMSIVLTCDMFWCVPNGNFVIFYFISLFMSILRWGYFTD